MRTIVIAALITALGAPARAESDPPIAPSGLAVQLGGGVTGFAGRAAHDLFRTGGYWDLRAVWGGGSVLGAEASYRASTNNARAGRMGGAQLLGDGAEAVARFNVPLQLDRLRLTPFVFAGAGWTYYQVVDAPSGWSADRRHASALVLPCGAGISGAFEHVVLDARLTYRGARAGELVAAGGGSVELQSWSAGLTVGYEI
jgi:hypothetical protein